MQQGFFKKNIPLFSWVTDYKRQYLAGDLNAGLTAGIMFIPQGMAYAMIAGLPPVMGLYAALVPQLVYAILGTSRHLSVGPVAMDSLIVASGLGALKLSGYTEYVEMAVFLALMIGLMQLAMGIIRLGFLVNYLSRPVISAFTSAAAVIIGLSQIKHFLGIDMPGSNQVHHLLLQIVDTAPQVNWRTVVVGACAVILLVGLKKIHRKIPAALVVVVLGVLAMFFSQWQLHGVAIVEDIPKGLPSLVLPNMGWDHIQSLFGIALTVALVGYMEVISIGKSIEEQHKDYEVRPNKELIAIGTSNIFASMFQAYPVAGSFSRSAVNNESGGKTPLAFVVSAALVGVTLLFLTPLFYYLPNAVLGAIIMVAVFKLIDFAYPITLFKTRKDEFFLHLITFLATIFVGITQGVLLGVLLSLILMVYRTSKPHIAILGQIKGTAIYKNVKRFPENVIIRSELLIFRFDAQLFFGNKDYFRSALLQEIHAKGSSLQYVIINAESIPYIDSTAVMMLSKTIQQLKGQGLQVIVSNAIGPARDIIFNSDLVLLIGSNNLFVSVDEAVQCIDKKTQQSEKHRRIAHQIIQKVKKKN
ncbi:MAG: sulfate permease [Flavobacteriaceae bacterium]|nr:sulfate permease [Flavobacteriaceae bacterium]